MRYINSGGDSLRLEEAEKVQEEMQRDTGTLNRTEIRTKVVRMCRGRSFCDPTPARLNFAMWTLTSGSAVPRKCP